MPMHDVCEVPFGVSCKTRLWFSDKVAKDVARFRRKGDPDKSFWKRIKRYAENGFALYEDSQTGPVKLEWEGVCRVGVHDSLFRLIGFYEDATKRDFIVLDTFLKRGQALSASDRARIDEVARIKRNRLWRKVRDEENFPRLAEGS